MKVRARLSLHFDCYQGFMWWHIIPLRWDADAVGDTSLAVTRRSVDYALFALRHILDLNVAFLLLQYIFGTCWVTATLLLQHEAWLRCDGWEFVYMLMLLFLWLTFNCSPKSCTVVCCFIVRFCPQKNEVLGPGWVCSVPFKKQISVMDHSSPKQHCFRFENSECTKWLLCSSWAVCVHGYLWIFILMFKTKIAKQLVPDYQSEK